MPRFVLRTTRPPDAFFEPSPAGRNDAILDGGEGCWSIYATGYYQGATVLIERALQPHSGRDLLVYPIIFLYRQCVELGLKMLIRDARDVTGTRVVDTPRTHDLVRLWNEARKLLAEIVSCEAFSEERATIDRCVHEFATVDRGSETFRYPATSNGSPVQYAVGRIDLVRFQTEIENAHLAIEALTSCVVARLDSRNEFRAENGP